MELVPEGATAPVMGEVLQPEQEERAPVAAGEVEVTTEQPEAAGDELLSTDEISGEYSAPGCVDVKICNSMTVAPLGPDAIETWRTGCCFFPCLAILGPVAGGEVRTRKPGTNAFLNPQYTDPNSDLMKFSADGTAKVESGGYKKRPGSQKRAFQKVDARDLAGKWCGCAWMPPIVYCCYTTKKALNQDQYAESGLCCCFMGLPIPISGTRTRVYVNGHATNGFAEDDGSGVHWHRGPGCAGRQIGGVDGDQIFTSLSTFFAKKISSRARSTELCGSCSYTKESVSVP